MRTRSLNLPSEPLKILDILGFSLTQKPCVVHNRNKGLVIEKESSVSAQTANAKECQIDQKLLAEVWSRSSSSFLLSTTLGH